MPTLRRTLLKLAPRLGLHATDLWPGTAVVSRRPGNQVVACGEGARLIYRPRAVRKDFKEVQKGLQDFLSHEHIAWMLRLYKVNCVLDVGANVGQYARWLRRCGFRGRIASFEPLQEYRERLEKASAKDPKWTVYPYALGREDTTTEINVVPNGTMSSLLRPSEFGAGRYKRFKRQSTETIEVRRLDGLLDEILDGLEDPRTYLKMDTQGYDLEAFAGAGDRVKEFVGLQSEVALLRIYEGSPRMRESIETYENAGFEVTGLFPVSREAWSGRVIEYDCVMMRADAAAKAG